MNSIIHIDMKIKSVLAFLTVTIVGFTYFLTFSFFSFKNSEFGFKGDSAIDFKKTLLKPLLLGVFSILGILSKIAYDQIKNTSDDSFKIGEVFKKTINSKYAWLSILVSPIVILSFYKNIETMDSYALISLLAFQNGFFFNSIISKATTNESKL